MKIPYGHRQEHNFSVAGSIEKHVSYRLSVGYTNQKTELSRLTIAAYTFNGGISPKFFERSSFSGLKSESFL